MFYILKKENLFIFILILLFFLLKTQLYNLVYIIADHLFCKGVISEVYNYNYLGMLLGCQEIVESEKQLDSKFQTFYSIIYNIFFVLSFLAGLAMVFKEKLKVSNLFLKWIVLFVFSFFLFDSINFITRLITYGFDFLQHVFQLRWWQPLEYFITLMMATYIFFFSFNKVEKLKVLGVILPVSILSGLLWFILIGPRILPVVTMKWVWLCLTRTSFFVLNSHSDASSNFFKIVITNRPKF